jgi:hypothetical protein
VMRPSLPVATTPMTTPTTQSTPTQKATRRNWAVVMSGSLHAPRGCTDSGMKGAAHESGARTTSRTSAAPGRLLDSFGCNATAASRRGSNSVLPQCSSLVGIALSHLAW